MIKQRTPVLYEHIYIMVKTPCIFLIYICDSFCILFNPNMWSKRILFVVLAISTSTCCLRTVNRLSQLIKQGLFPMRSRQSGGKKAVTGHDAGWDPGTLSQRTRERGREGSEGEEVMK